MQKIVALFGLLSILLCGCYSYYEDRLLGSYRLDYTYLNGNKVDTCDIEPNLPNTYYRFDLYNSLTIISFLNNEMQEATQGSWHLIDNNKSLKIKFVLRGKKYEYTASIKKIRYKQLKYEYKDANGNIWVLEMYK